VPRKQDFHTVNCLGTEVVIAAARIRGHPSYESQTGEPARHHEIDLQEVGLI
jgi:hypothetical protein